MTTPSEVVGVDGCRGGWLAVAAAPDLTGARAAIHANFANLKAAHPRGLILVDTPVGLPDNWSDDREVEKAARRFLSARNRRGFKSVASRVFNAPCRRALAHFQQGADYAELNRRSDSRKLSRQSYFILDKISDADSGITPADQGRIREGHPELAFALTAGETLPPKKHKEGRAERIAVLRDIGFDTDALSASLGVKARRWGLDDLFDACILAQVARRCVTGEAQRIPDAPAVDQRGLRMEMWA